ncbi:conserved exported protein of unknown function [Rhodovastum atsumiense]|uniref:Uncharacterized protein n=1 Tax=Rhodovastum atsumiense TaxID=504468 RepID=A0A5M6IWF9_9PROT|nr:hypothetical protein [Rhodovastum atsumiense]KAA5612177.1 hypothetical protein F1189_10970 [Rhodovastum atsumiense]CAH2603870.1 conserved exported protein of unknown function [Rhodovastum atsumiense]
MTWYFRRTRLTRVMVLAVATLAMARAAAAQPRLEELAGLWTTGPATACPAKSYVWSATGNDMTFRDQAGRVDAERVTGRRADGFTTETLASTTTPVGTQWDYRVVGPDSVQVRNLSNGRGFTLSRCPAGTGLQRWSGTWKRENAEITIRVVGNQLQAEGNASWIGRVPGAVHVGQFSERAVPRGSRVTFGRADECLVEARLEQARLVVQDNAGCGGLNVSFNGVYTRAGATSERPRAAPQAPHDGTGRWQFMAPDGGGGPKFGWIVSDADGSSEIAGPFFVCGEPPGSDDIFFGFTVAPDIPLGRRVTLRISTAARAVTLTTNVSESPNGHAFSVVLRPDAPLFSLFRDTGMLTVEVIALEPPQRFSLQTASEPFRRFARACNLGF